MIAGLHPRGRLAVFGGLWYWRTHPRGNPGCPDSPPPTPTPPGPGPWASAVESAPRSSPVPEGRSHLRFRLSRRRKPAPCSRSQSPPAATSRCSAPRCWSRTPAAASSRGAARCRRTWPTRGGSATRGSWPPIGMTSPAPNRCWRGPSRAAPPTSMPGVTTPTSCGSAANARRRLARSPPRSTFRRPIPGCASRPGGCIWRSDS